MKQLKKNVETPEVGVSEDLKNKFNEIKGREIKKADSRVVNFYIQVGCGCGGAYDKYHAEIPIDKNIPDGYHFSDFEDYMENVEEGWV